MYHGSNSHATRAVTQEHTAPLQLTGESKILAMMGFTHMVAALNLIGLVARSPLVLGLGVGCLVVALAVLFAASRGKLHVPGYVGLALASFAVALILGRASGAQSIRGTHTGALLSILFFLLVAVSIGSVLAIFFYREPPET